MNDTASPRSSAGFSPVSGVWAAVLLAGSAAASWWLVHTPAAEEARAGGFALGEADYAVEPLPLPGWAEAVVGPVGLAQLVFVPAGLLCLAAAVACAVVGRRRS